MFKNIGQRKIDIKRSTYVEDVPADMRLARLDQRVLWVLGRVHRRGRRQEQGGGRGSELHFCVRSVGGQRSTRAVKDRRETGTMKRDLGWAMDLAARFYTIPEAGKEG